MAEPLIEGTQIYHLPEDVNSVEEFYALDQPTQLRYALAAQDYRYHWAKGGYSPTKTVGGRRHEKQVAFHADAAPFRAVVSGRGFGKSFMGAAEAVKWAIENPGSEGVIIAPNYPMLATSTRKYFLQVLQREAIAHYDKKDNVIRLTNGSVVWIRSGSDPQKLRGLSIAWAWIDEACQCKEEVWDMTVATLRQGGQRIGAWFTTSPLGYDWIWRMFEGPKKLDGYNSIRGGSIENPHNPPSYVENLRKKYGEGSLMFRQEALGEFVGVEGIVYQQFRRELHVFKDLPVFEEFFIAIDWGWNAPCAIVVVGLDKDRSMYVLEETYADEMPMPLIKDTLSAYYDKYGKCLIIADSNAPREIEDLNSSGFWCEGIPKGPNSITEGIACVQARLAVAKNGKPRLFIHEQCEMVLFELSMYRYAPTVEGKNIKATPIKANDHAMDAIRYLVMWVDGAMESWGVLNSPELDELMRP